MLNKPICHQLEEMRETILTINLLDVIFENIFIFLSS